MARWKILIRPEISARLVSRPEATLAQEDLDADYTYTPFGWDRARPGRRKGWSDDGQLHVLWQHA
ncbi:MAG: hypothetical protein PVJ55_07840 [Anaerolineae bacterium]